MLGAVISRPIAPRDQLREGRMDYINNVKCFSADDVPEDAAARVHHRKNLHAGRASPPSDLAVVNRGWSSSDVWRGRQSSSSTSTSSYCCRGAFMVSSHRYDPTGIC
jgi:hypothetical protein